MFGTKYLVIIPELLQDTANFIAVFGFNTRLLGLCFMVVAYESKKRNVRLWIGFTCLITGNGVEPLLTKGIL
jgi:hypothetical protein